MFLYKINSIDKLLTIAKNRSYVQDHPELCKLLENPLLKDDTELAIRYNEYKLNYPNSAQALVDYYYTHGPELDTGSLIDWRKKIQNDPELLEYASYKDTQISNIWTEKQDKKDYSWVGDILDCLSKPCSYLGMISPVIGSIGDTQSKYNNKNTNGTDESITLLGLPTYMVNKLPKYISQGIMQLTDMISEQSKDVVNVLEKTGTSVKEDPYVIKQSELIGGDILSDIASRMGDCFRIYEYQRRYNPYDYDQNKEQADKFGTVVFDEHGNPKTISPNGNQINMRKSDIYSDNRRLSPKTTTQDIIMDNIGLINNENAMPMKITAYNAILLSDNRYFIDHTTDKYGERGHTCGTAMIMPNSFTGAKALSQTNVDLKCGCATRPRDVLKYFQALLANKFENIILPKNFLSLITNAYKTSNLNVTLFFPNGQRTLPVFDTGGGPVESPWIDITAQYFFTKEGHGLANIYSSEGVITSDSPTPYPIDSSSLSNIIPQSAKIKALKVLGSDNNMVNGIYFFSEDFCKTNGLDPLIYSQPGPAPLI